MGRLENAIKNGHDPATCTCSVCVLGRGEDPADYGHKKFGRKPHTGKRRAASRGYLWLSGEDDERVHQAADRLGVSCSEFVRQAILAKLEQVESGAQLLSPRTLVKVRRSPSAPVLDPKTGKPVATRKCKRCDDIFIPHLVQRRTRVSDTVYCHDCRVMRKAERNPARGGLRA